MKFSIEHAPGNIDPGKWSRFVAGHPDGNFFQSPRFFEFIQSVPGIKPVVLAAVTPSKEIIGLLVGMIQRESGFLLTRFSSRLIVRGGPLVTDEDPQIVEDLLNALVKKYGGQCIYFEFRNLYPMDAMKCSFLKQGYIHSDYLNFLVDIEGHRASVQKMSSGKKRQIKKSLASGAVIVETVTLDQVRKFYAILRELYLRKVKKPLPDWTFFEKFFHQPSAGRYFLVEYAGEIIGGIMCPVFGKKTIYEWYVAGEDGKHPGIYPSVLATWAPIDFALRNGISQFDFLGAGKPDEQYGVRDFKAGFGGEQVNYGRFTRINSRFLYSVGKAGLRVWGRLRQSRKTVMSG